MGWSTGCTVWLVSFPPIIKKNQQTPSIISDRNSDIVIQIDDHLIIIAIDHHWASLNIIDNHWPLIIVDRHWPPLIISNHHYNHIVMNKMTSSILIIDEYYHESLSSSPSPLIIIVTLSILMIMKHWKGLTMTNSNPSVPEPKEATVDWLLHLLQCWDKMPRLNSLL